MQAHASYATDNKEWIAGSPSTSGFDCLPPAAGNPYLKMTAAQFNGVTTQTYDFYGPLLSSMGYQGPNDGNATQGQNERAERFDQVTSPRAWLIIISIQRDKFTKHYSRSFIPSIVFIFWDFW